ncbi:MAG: class I SAM-dependent methyltransferase [Theionarchaea archaeon]|nr:class I SAM-dependent methyltransferase [Theionarchaea archaeon]MBU7000120.1 class I SAM-dependent methyltransferase [Theionarchaea archaeon]MBU7020837.1 class I SAM-dependent methyltransferase [Theionarchaea archaeon]MBU7033927.1 class I SAM-dependent methyltransferase [Theionarchaea archaeon]MBU7039223.1 class I SAM-dependent methyltransferase [Theionarchaea archaeon]
MPLRTARKRRVQTDYDRTALFYEKRYLSIQWEKYSIMMENHLKGCILDLGCGTGLLSEYLHSRIVGIDISFKMLDQARTRERVVQGDMDFLPFRNEVFDAVVSFTSLQNLSDVNPALKEVRRVLKSGSPFIVTLLNKGSSVEKEIEKYFTIISIRQCGEDIGFICW